MPLAFIPRLLPIMVFDSSPSGQTFQARMREWAAEIDGWNAVQAQLRLTTGGEFVPLDPRCPVVKVGGLPPTIRTRQLSAQQALYCIVH